MIRKTAICVGIAAALSVPAHAQQHIGKIYRYEINAEYSHGEYSADGFDDTEFDNAGVSGTYYFGGVDNTNGPYTENAFLNKASDISARYKYREIDDNDIDVDGDEYGVAGRWVTDRGSWIFEGTYERLEPEDAEVDTYSLGIGKYLTDNLTLVATYANADVEDGGDTDGGQLGVEYFWGLSGDAGIKLEGAYGIVDVDDDDDIDIYNVGATWYVNKNFGIGGAYGNFDGGGVEVDRYRAFAEWFVTRGIAVSLAYRNDDLEDSDLERDEITLGVRLRY